MCNGQLLPINQNQALFSILGTTYGGDGRVNFALPDMRGRVPFHVGQGLVEGERAGEENHTVIMSEMPAHNHLAFGTTTTATTGDPTGNVWATPSINIYAATSNTTMAPQCVSNIGGSQPHNNVMPYLAINFIISLFGVFPSQS